MEGIHHPFTRALYERADDGSVRITTTDGRVGRYRADGSRIDGDKLDADPHLCGWVAGPRAPHRLASQKPDVS